VGNTSEAAYVGYAAVAIPRSVAGFTVAGDTVSNAALTQFPQCTGGAETLTHFSICDAGTGAAKILVSAALSSPRSISSGIQPQFAPGVLQAVAA
jgi:hypothetical protein